MPQAGNLGGKSVSEILNYSLDPNVLKSAIGVAAMNAISQPILDSGNEEGYRFVKEGDGFDLLDIQPDETVALIGAFTPYIRRLKMTGNPFFIIEKNPRTLRLDEGKWYRPETEMASTLAQSDAIVMTGTAMVNHTIDAILSLITDHHWTAIIGPTASMIPDAFFERGVQVMAGVRISNPTLMIKILKQGGSAYHLLRECSEKIALIKA